MKYSKKDFVWLMQTYSELNQEMARNTSIKVMEKREKDFARLTPDEQCEVLLYRIYFDMYASTEECLNRRVAYVTSSEVRVIGSKLEEASEFLAHLHFMLSNGYENCINKLDVIKLGACSVVTTTRFNVVFVTS
jgi:hypothetical protein